MYELFINTKKEYDVKEKDRKQDYLSRILSKSDTEPFTELSIHLDYLTENAMGSDPLK